MSKDFYVEARKIQFQIDKCELAINEEIMAVEMLKKEPPEAARAIENNLWEIMHYVKKRQKLNEEM